MTSNTFNSKNSNLDNTLLKEQLNTEILDEINIPKKLNLAKSYILSFICSIFLGSANYLSGRLALESGY